MGKVKYLMKRLTIHFYGVILAIIFAVIACTSVEKNPEQTQNSMKGQKILGEQLMIAIQMKKKKDLD